MFPIDSVVQWKHLLEELALVLAIMEKTQSTEPYWIHYWHPRWLEVLNFILIIIFYLKYPMLREHAPCKYFCMETTFDG
jgi:hypothetical protein